MIGCGLLIGSKIHQDFPPNFLTAHWLPSGPIFAPAKPF
jgi:hypothetical protein